MEMNVRHLLAGFALATGACTAGAPPLDNTGPRPVETACSTGSARLSFDFEAASFSRCVIEGEREFSVLVAPEHQPPINPSPWYAFDIVSTDRRKITLTLDYGDYKHRYSPDIWTEAEGWRP